MHTPHMTVHVRDSSWKWLSDVKGLKDADFLAKAKAFLTSDFEQAFEVIRTQKLLSRSRSLEVTNRICSDLSTWAKTAPIHNKKKNKLIRHCRLTVGFQSLISSVRQDTDALDIWHLAFPDFAAILISTLGAADIEFDQQMAERKQAPNASEYFEVNSNRNWLTRSMLDYSLLVLNEGRKRCSGKSDFTLGNPKAFTRSIQLAMETAEIITTWDHYSFARVDLSVAAEAISVNKPDTLTAIRRRNYRKRMMELDISHRSSVMQQFSLLAETFKQEITTVDLPISFDEFLVSTAGTNILARLLNVTQLQETRIAELLDQIIDLDTEVKIGRLKHVYRDLITVWAYLVRLAFASKIWGELVHTSTGEYPIVTITVGQLRGTFVGLREISPESQDRAIIPFSSSTDQRDRIDLFYAPLLHVNEQEFIFASSYVLASRFDRNLISIIAREKNDSLAVKGKKPLRKLRSLFESGGFRCLENIVIRDDQGRIVTDLDLMAYQGEDIFLFQSKVLSIPDSAYEYWRVDQTLLSAALQMDLVMSHKMQVERACQRDDPSFNLTGSKVTAYLLTDVMVHSGFMLNGYLVVDFDYLEHLLRGANLAVLDVFEQKAVGMFSVIEGDFPSSAELRGLISDLSVPKAHPPKVNSKGKIERGGWTLTLDAKSFI